MSASRNLGVHAGHGSLVGFLDADDVWLPEKLSEQVAILERHPRASMVYGRTLMWRGWRSGAEPGRDFFYDLGVEPDRLYDPPRLLPLLVRNRFQTPTTCNALVRREVYDDLGGFEEDFAALYEDQVFFAKLHLQHPTFVAGACWARYRQHAGNSERRFSYARYYRRRRPFLEWLATYLAAAAADDELAAIVADELRRARRPRRAAVAARMALASAR
jgi:GT2 family glycosyltransferase